MQWGIEWELSLSYFNNIIVSIQQNSFCGVLERFFDGI